MSILWHNKYANLKHALPVTTVIIAAAGSGVRMGGVSKPLYELHGKKVLLYSLEVFEKSEFVKQIVISARKEDVQEIELLLKQNGIQKVTGMAEGGDTRQESVLKAFKVAFHKKEDITPFVAIHDAARPMLTMPQFEDAVRTALKYGTAVCAAKVRDTMKRTDKAGFTVDTVEREDLWQIQTPQIFDTDLFHTALSVAEQDNYTATDESTLLSNAGFKVKLFECSYENMKLTYPEDIRIAEAILALREGNLS